MALPNNPTASHDSHSSNPVMAEQAAPSPTSPLVRNPSFPELEKPLSDSIEGADESSAEPEQHGLAGS